MRAREEGLGGGACESGGIGEAIGGQGEWFVVQRVGEWRGCVKWS